MNRLEADNAARREVTDHSSIDEFLSGVQSRAYQVAYGALWDRETALDVVQESMLRFVEYYRDKAQREWPALFRTVLNSRINDERRRRMLAQSKRKLLSLTTLGFSDTGVDEQMTEAELPDHRHEAGLSTPEAGAGAGELKVRIEQALGKLAERQRQVFLLREQLGLTIRESAATLGCSENSIKQHHFRALQAMRRHLSEVWDDVQD